MKATGFLYQRHFSLFYNNKCLTNKQEKIATVDLHP